jgi:hypothetical protein
MPPDAIAFLVGLMLIPFLFLIFWRVLFNPKYGMVLFAFAIASVVGGIIEINSGPPGKPNFYLFLFCPLYQLLLLKLMVYLFRRGMHRDPVNPPRGSSFTEDGLGWDRLFSMVFLISSLALPVAVMGYYYS